MNDELKLLDDIFGFLQETPIVGRQSERHVQCKQYLANKIREMQQPPITQQPKGE